MSNSSLNHWIVGSSFGRSDDQTPRFLAEGIWDIAKPSDAEQALVKAMQPGDLIAIKSTFVQKHDLPFDAQGQSVSVMRIKARGKVIQNPGNGECVDVEWDHGYEGADWYFYTYRSTIWQLPMGDEEAHAWRRSSLLNSPRIIVGSLPSPIGKTSTGMPKRLKLSRYGSKRHW